MNILQKELHEIDTKIYTKVFVSPVFFSLVGDWDVSANALCDTLQFSFMKKRSDWIFYYAALSIVYIAYIKVIVR